MNYLCHIESLREAKPATRAVVTKLLTILKAFLVRKLLQICNKDRFRQKKKTSKWVTVLNKCIQAWGRE